jgi:acid phosphatase (class A)
MVDPPITPSFPAGHALQGYLMARLVAEARPAEGPMLARLAERIAENRIVAGLHYRADNTAGIRAAEMVFNMLATREEGHECAAFLALLEAAKEETAVVHKLPAEEIRVPLQVEG